MTARELAINKVSAKIAGSLSYSLLPAGYA
jgi:hypothetical protein